MYETAAYLFLPATHFIFIFGLKWQSTALQSEKHGQYLALNSTPCNSLTKVKAGELCTVINIISRLCHEDLMSFIQTLYSCNLVFSTLLHINDLLCDHFSYPVIFMFIGTRIHCASHSIFLK